MTEKQTAESNPEPAPKERANERIEAKRQQGYVYGALQYECNDDVVRLALLERLLSEESQK